jgi:hypothetical protein
MPETPEKTLSDAIFDPVSKAYKVGGFGLAFLALGAFLMLFAAFLPASGSLRYVVVSTGFVLIALTCVLFFIQDVRPLLSARRSIDQNRELIDSVQLAALQATEIASDLQSLAFKHASAVAMTMQTLRPHLRQIPVIGKFVDSELVTRTDALSAAIVDYTGRAKKAINDLEDALVRSDPAALKKYSTELAAIRTHVEDLLKSG